MHIEERSSKRTLRAAEYRTTILQPYANPRANTDPDIRGVSLTLIVGIREAF